MNKKSIFKDNANKNLIHSKIEKGITLIALVITIIIMVILAGISINMIIGESGILNQAISSTEKTRAEKINEKISMIMNANEIAEYQEGKEITKEEAVEQLVEEKLLTEEEAKILAHMDKITIEGTEIDFSQLKDDGFDYFYRKYIVRNVGYIVYNENGNMALYDFHDNIIAQIPFSCITYEPNLITINGTGDLETGGYDGKYRISDDNHYIYLVNDEGESIISWEEGYCIHTNKNDFDTIYWHNFYDENNNEISLNSIEDVSELNNYTLRCKFCYEKVDFVQTGNYLYLYNDMFDPQKMNGEQLSGMCFDIWYEKLNGWSAIPFDVAKTDGLLTSINGEPIVLVYFYNNMYVPKTTQYILTYPTEFTIKENKEPAEYAITYEGTIDEFKKIKNDITNDQKFFDKIKSYCDHDNTILSFVIKCKDGDLVIK